MRVVSYNVLSSHLAEPSHYPTYPEEHLAASNRLPVVLKKLEKELNECPETVLCLQEVSYDWMGALHAFLAKNKYHVVAANYGKPFNGYMGVCLAWNTDCFDVESVDITRLSETGEWPPRDPEPNLFKRLVTSALSPFGLVDTTEDPWNMAERRHNAMITAVLRQKSSQRLFAISNYHMPCAFYAPKVMTLHADLAVRHVEQCSEHTCPYILAGDFNFKPHESVYQLVTTGQMDTNDPYHPEPKNEVEWKPSAQPLRSAYAVVNGKEPDFTNYAQSRNDDEPFCETLDYIFVSPTVNVTSVRPIPHRDDVQGPFPNLDVDEPSDHVLIAADVQLGK